MVDFNAYIVCSVFPRQCRSTHWVRWELGWSFDDQLCQEYFYRQFFVKLQSIMSDMFLLGHSVGLLSLNSKDFSFTCPRAYDFCALFTLLGWKCVVSRSDCVIEFSAMLLIYLRSILTPSLLLLHLCLCCF